MMRKQKRRLKISGFDIAKGEKVLILGPSGSGKSTPGSVSPMVSYLISIKARAKGQVRIAGQNIFKHPSMISHS